jgi:LacI family transcriptional regulator, galactose operon repressor
MAVTIRDIARKANVSPSTVSKCFNSKAYYSEVSEETRRKIYSLAKKLNYNFGKVSRQRGGNIGILSQFLFPKGSDMPWGGFYTELLERLESSLIEKDFNMMMSSFTGASPKMIRDQDVQGVLIVGRLGDTEFLRKLKNSGFPVVLVDDECFDFPIDSVITDNVVGAYTAVKHLISLGHQRIAFVAEKSQHPAWEERFEGYLRALEEADISLDKSLIARIPLGYSLDFSEEPNIFKADNVPTAVFAANDYFALMILEKMKQLGLRCPEDVSVVGFDDRPIATTCEPALTTVQVPLQCLAEHAVNRLIELMENPDKEPIKINIYTRLIERKSCGAIKNNQEIVMKEVS